MTTGLRVVKMLTSSTGYALRAGHVGEIVVPRSRNLCSARYHSDYGVLDVDCSPRLSIIRTNKVLLENFRFEIRVPEAISGVHFDSIGRFDEKSRIITCELGKLENRTVVRATLRYECGDEWIRRTSRSEVSLLTPVLSR